MEWIHVHNFMTVVYILMTILNNTEIIFKLIKYMNIYISDCVEYILMKLSIFSKCVQKTLQCTKILTSYKEEFLDLERGFIWSCPLLFEETSQTVAESLLKPERKVLMLGKQSLISLSPLNHLQRYSLLPGELIGSSLEWKAIRFEKEPL